MDNDCFLRCCVIDDEPLARHLIASYIEKTPGLALSALFESGSEALQRIRNGDFEILFLDIDMPGLSGIELAELVPSDSRIVYITAYGNFALDGFRVNALDYLLKPVSYSEFLRAVAKAREWKETQDSRLGSSPVLTSVPNPSFIIVRSEHRIMRIRLNSINFIEVKGDRSIINRQDSPPRVNFNDLGQY